MHNVADLNTQAFPLVKSVAIGDFMGIKVRRIHASPVYLPISHAAQQYWTSDFGAAWRRF
jgi:hypothetical protein